LIFSTVSVENFVGNGCSPVRNACPVLIPDPLPSFAAIDASQQNQQLSAFAGFHHDALQQSRRFS
jgi:hypothetical protein